MSDTVDTQQAASHLGLQKSTLDKWRSQGKGPRFVRMGRAIRYRVTDLDAYMERNVRDPEAPRPRRRSAA